MSSFELLSANMKKKIWDMKWDRFTPIQEKTIPIIIQTTKDVIVSSGTASGKTEAALLPVISLIEKEARFALKAVYVSPLKALINNQFERIDKLCEYSDIAIHRWHGDVSQSKKNKFLQNPTGILQITPESIESLFVNRTNQLRAAFKDVEFIIIDEIHAFFDNARGVHLRSLLSRLSNYTTRRPRIVGLSATVDNFEMVRSWVSPNHPENVEIVEVTGSDKELMFHLMHVPSNQGITPCELFEDIRELTRHQKSIIFCNNRGQVEEVTVALNRLAEKDGMGETYYPHHSSIDKKEREHVEKVMSSESSYPKSVVATSSLELGIDIGNIDVVIQIDSTYSVSSLKQRLGRSGRKRDAAQMLQLYSTNDDSLVQSLAVMELIIEKWVEPSKGYLYPFDVLFQQIISISQELNGILFEALIMRIKENEIFYDLRIEDAEHLIQHMIDNDILEVVRGRQEIIVGLEGERILRGKDFYSVFMTVTELEVIEGAKKIGKLDRSFIVNVGDNIILGGRLWSIKDIDYERNKVYVTKAVNGKKPRYSGNPGYIHKKIGEKMMEILCSAKEFTYVNEDAGIALRDIRRKYSFNQVTSSQRVIWFDVEEGIFDTFTGTTITKTLVWMLRYFGVTANVKDHIGRIVIIKPKNIPEVLKKIVNKNWNMEELIPFIEEHEMLQTKYSEHIGEHLHVKMHIANEVTIKETIDYLNSFEFRCI